MRKTRNHTILTLLSLLPLAFAACGDDSTVVELTVIETIPVDFDDMQGGVVEGAIIDLDDLRDEPAYAEARPSLRCAGVNLATSFLEVEALQVGAGATAVEYNVDVAPRGGQLTRLATFNGSISLGDRIALDDQRFAIDPGGRAVVSQVVLSEFPSMSVQISASVPAALQDLQIAVSLTIDFSSDSQGCP